MIALAVLVKNTDISFFLTGPPREDQQVRQGGVGLLNGYRLAIRSALRSRMKLTAVSCGRLLYTKTGERRGLRELAIGIARDLCIVYVFR